MKTILLIFIVSASAVTSQLLLKRGVKGLDFSCFSMDLVQKVVYSPFIVTSIVLQLSSFVVWLVVISKANLGYAFGITGAFLYLMLPLLSWLIYGEKLAIIQWVGLILITVGIACLLKGDLAG